MTNPTVQYTDDEKFILTTDEGIVVITAAEAKILSGSLSMALSDHKWKQKHGSRFPASLPLDPFPWQHHYNAADRYAANTLPGGLLDFVPGAMYEQDPARYPFGVRH